MIPDAISTEVERPTSAIFFIDDDTVSQNQRAIATSLLVNDLLDSKGVERRMMSTDQSAGSSEPWMSTLVDISPDDKSSLVLYYDEGKASVLDIPNSVDQIRELVSAW